MSINNLQDSCLQKYGCKWIEGRTPVGGLSLTWSADLTNHTAEAIMRRPDGSPINMVGVFDSITPADPLATPPVEPKSVFHFNVDGADLQAGISVIRIIVADASGAIYPHVDIQVEVVDATP